MLEHPKRRDDRRALGLWVTIGMVSAFAGLAADPAQAPHAAPDLTIEAGPVDDTIDYIDCLVKRLLNLPCPGDEAPPAAPPIEPIE